MPFAHSSAAMSVEASKELAGRTAVDNHVSGDTRFANQQSLKTTKLKQLDNTS